jgi:hypothetical protein
VLGDQPRQCREPQPVARLVADPADLAAQHGVLVPEHQKFGILGHLTPYPVSSRTAFSLTPSWCSAPTSANAVLGTTPRKSPLTPAFFMASAIGPTSVLPNGTWVLRYPDFSPAASQDFVNPVADFCELTELE